MIVQQIEVGKMAVFSYVISGEEGGSGAVIDPGGDAEKILEKARLKGISITYIINTHTHIDHISANADMKAATGAKIVVHEEEGKSLTRIYKQVLGMMLNARPSPPADMLVHDGDLISCGNLTIKVIHTPGHTKGGICLLAEGNLFTGDTLFVGGVGRTDLPGGSMRTLQRSIGEKLLTLPDVTIVWPGHNYGDTPNSTVGREKKTNPFLSGI